MATKKSTSKNPVIRKREEREADGKQESDRASVPEAVHAAKEFLSQFGDVRYGQYTWCSADVNFRGPDGKVIFYPTNGTASEIVEYMNILGTLVLAAEKKLEQQRADRERVAKAEMQLMSVLQKARGAAKKS